MPNKRKEDRKKLRKRRLVCKMTHDRAMAQAVSCQPLTVEANVRAQVSPSGICGGQSGAGTGISLSSSDFPCQYHSTIALRTHI
jgi:hypothetical protein